MLPEFVWSSHEAHFSSLGPDDRLRPTIGVAPSLALTCSAICRANQVCVEGECVDGVK